MMSTIRKALLRGILLVMLIHVGCSHYTQQWVIYAPGGKQVADAVADEHGFINMGEIFKDYYHLKHPSVTKRSIHPHRDYNSILSKDERVHWAEQQKAKTRTKRDYLIKDDDPKWPYMWYLNRGNGLDMNVVPVWKEGITGEEIVVTILDDGLEIDHPDLIDNYDPLASYDVNGYDLDPTPRYDMIDSNRHGTRCAGEVAAKSNNSVCGVGIAPGSSIGGVRMLDGEVTDAVEARSLSLNPQYIDIYSASWGPDDDGKSLDGPGPLATRAFIEGVSKGRRGKGSIFVWASGNGGREHDNCNCDGYANSIFTLSISSVTETGRVPWYSEACSSTLAATYSSGAITEKQIITTDLRHSCTNGHTGTSASAPLAAGICALALDANPRLTWRDMQHIVVRTARPENLISPDWQINGIGRKVSHNFGYGLMDAYAMVKLARVWETVPEQYHCEVHASIQNKPIPPKSAVVVELDVKQCPQVQVLEHVQAKLSITAQRRGDLRILLRSPMGTNSTLLTHRPHDASKTGFYNWPFMSVHTWGETPIGTWQLEVHNDGRLLGKLMTWSMVMYGTETPPGRKVGSTEKMPYTAPPDMFKEVDQPPVEFNSIQSTEHKWGSELEIDAKEETTPYVNSINSGCVKSKGSYCLECNIDYHYMNGMCVKECPEQYYSSKAMIDKNHRAINRRSLKSKELDIVMSSTCFPCHYSCRTCSGPFDYQCMTCYEDADLFSEGEFETYCYAKYVVNKMHNSMWLFQIYIVLVVIASFLMFMTIICFMKCMYFYKRM